MKNSIIQKLIIFCFILGVLPLFFFTLLAAGGIRILFLAIIFAAPTVVLTVWLIFYIRKRIIQPLDILTHEAENISCGNLSNEIKYKRNDEIGRFVSAFDHMRSKLDEQQKEQQHFEVERKNFIDSISHDLKTPISSISAHVEALQDGIAATPEEKKQYLKVIENKLSILTELSNQLSLSYATPDTLDIALQNVNCYQWTNDFLDDMRTECQIHGIVPDLKNLVDADNKASMCISLYQFDRALQNILSNAFRYTKDAFLISAEIREQKYFLRIENDGVTLPNSNAERIFDRFYTEEDHNARGHLGLGLYITNTIIQAMNGSVKAEVESGKIIFVITLHIS